MEIFSFVLNRKFSLFFHIIGSRIGAFGLFPFLDGDTISLFDGDVLTCHVSLNFGGTHHSVRARMDRLRRAGGAAWMEHLRAAGRSPAAVGRRSERVGAAGARAMSGRRRRSRRRRRRVARRRPLRGVEVRGLGEFGQVALELGGLDGKRGALLGAASLPAPLEGAARATSPARVIMHVGSPDAARAQDVASRWSRRARSWRRACRDGRSHRGRGARPHDRARRDKRDGQRDGVEPRGRRHRG